jgi:UDP-glucose 4-epimerase
MPDLQSAFSECRVLVTGGAGFIGSHLTEELVRQGAQVTVADDLSSGREENLSAVRSNIKLSRFDLCQDDIPGLLSQGRFSAIFHLAANAHLVASVSNPRRDFEQNASATLRLLEAVRDVSPQSAVIYTSSASIYGEGMGQPLRESDSPAPIVPYAISKLAAEYYVTVFHKLYGLRTATVRLFSVYGPRLRKQVVYDLMGKIQANPLELPIYGDGSQERDFNHVTNVVEACLLVARKSSLAGEVYNVGGEETISIRQLSEMLCERMGVQPRFAYTGQVRAGEAQRWVADISKLRNLGYCHRVTLREGLTDTVRWFESKMMNDQVVAAQA